MNVNCNGKNSNFRYVIEENCIGNNNYMFAEFAFMNSVQLGNDCCILKYLYICKYEL